MNEQSIYNFDVKTIDGNTLSMSEFKDQVLIIANTASKCGFTSQYQGLEQLYQKYKNKGFAVLGFPCNQFGHQEPGDEKEIKSFCSLNYNVSFPMFAKIKVNGKEAHPLFEYLKKEKKGFLWSSIIKWNFTKFLIDRNGNVVKRYASNDKPEELESDITKLLLM